MQIKIKKILVIIVGIIFIVLGLFGLVLPFLQGIIFLIIGFLLLSLCFPKIRLRIKKHTERHKHLSSTINKIETWLVKFIGDM
ncbi:hypothetical protein A3A03_00910 [Candidatus Nomurabacteria bacterium RIFCSPLOWO2_01_FULL_40_18]|uniref:DUF454 domain-containing protein n=1 Tax=Candidatus Nomurabacteria bacterium RIFCSPLOWO2_01_FULL_40_18 TaxID=1801773 RepID=A0A1F6XL05_9BACT|nr:MAG: hypothetical protein A3A03_00910 [Candidatus Nomurabacteria bacterium RIFCSPLOWO2_01_FULL_40_18]